MRRVQLASPLLRNGHRRRITRDRRGSGRLEPGATIGRYRVESLIGAGGMGLVYRATDLRLDRPVALKLLTPALASDARASARFEREARLLASVNHPGIATIHGIEDVPQGIALDTRALVLEFIEGPSLSERLLGGALPIVEALSLARQIAAALEAAHDRGVVHRDVKPANIKIGPGGVVKVLDFGIACLDPDHAPARPAVETMPGELVGTPAYMSPEQARGLVVDKRTDIWAFGCVLFEMLTGRGAFAADTACDSLVKIVREEPDWSTLPPATPASIERLIQRCLRKDPAQRLHDIADARIEVDDALADLPRRPAAVQICAVER
ncbi:MAG TPA: serine/threonine-protein kinase [Vicinamibacterales bacterium]|nr:serine/threonine-protein kinase [Vicinamibacterales bacterium]